MANYNFPQGIGSNIVNGQPYMLLTSYESKNAIESTGHTGFSNNNTNLDYEPGIAKSSIALYIPPNALKTAFTATYESTPGAATKAAMGAAWSKETGALDVIWAGLKGAGISLGEAAAKQADKGTGMLTAQGVAINNHLALTYKGPTQFRSHEFSFAFFPKNKGEADIVQKILKDLENGMLPRVGGVNATKVSGRALSAPFFQSPRHWTIDFFKKNGERNKYLMRIGKSVITSLSINHDQQSTVSLHTEDESPVQTTLAISFQEIELQVSADKGMENYDEGELGG
jgi:hypothetical protein